MMGESVRWVDGRMDGLMVMHELAYLWSFQFSKFQSRYSVLIQNEGKMTI